MPVFPYSITAAKTNLGAVLAAATPIGLNQDGTAQTTADGSPSVRSTEPAPVEPSTGTEPIEVKTVSNTRARLLLQAQADEQRRMKSGLKVGK